MTPPAPARTHIWDGTHTLPDWLTGHRWHGDQLVIRTPDGDTRPQPGWWLIAWSDGTVTAASPTVAERVYGPDGLRGQLQHAEHEITRHAEAEAADIAAGSYARRVEELQAGHDRIRRLAARIRQGAPWAANFDDLADHIVGALDGEQQADTGPEPDDLTGAYTPDPPIGCLTPAAAPEPSGVPVTDPPSGVSPDEARQMRDELLAHTRPDAWTPPPPGSTAEQLPDDLLALIRGGMPDYTSTACMTAYALAVAVHWSHPRRAELGQWAARMHNRCRRNQKFTGQLCVCGCH